MGPVFLLLEFALYILNTQSKSRRSRRGDLSNSCIEKLSSIQVGGNTDVSSYLTADLFLILIFEFFMMMIDRIIYDYCWLPGKVCRILVNHSNSLVQVVHLTISLLVTHLVLLTNPPMQLGAFVVVVYYLIKCIYWYLSAKQVCFGYKLNTKVLSCHSTFCFP